MVSTTSAGDAVTALDNVSKTQFMPVSDLMDMQSLDALGMKRHQMGEAAKPGPDTTMRDIYPLKVSHIESGESHIADLDEHIKSGSIDPVLLATTSGGEDQIIEGQHRIARAHQLGVEKLPYSRDPASQAHRMDWDDD